MMRFELKSRKHFHKVFGEYVDLSETYTFDCLYTVFKLLSIVPEINNPNYSFKLYNREELVAENEEELDKAREYAKRVEMTEEETEDYIIVNTIRDDLMFNGRTESHSHTLESDEIFRTRDDGFEFYVFADGSWSLIADNEIKYREYELVTGPPRSPFTRIKFPDPENQCSEEILFIHAEEAMELAASLLPKNKY